MWALENLLGYHRNGRRGEFSLLLAAAKAALRMLDALGDVDSSLRDNHSTWCHFWAAAVIYPNPIEPSAPEIHRPEAFGARGLIYAQDSRRCTRGRHRRCGVAKPRPPEAAPEARWALGSPPQRAPSQLR